MRQKVRKCLLLISFLAFPITIWYFSPYLIINAAMEHIINGSFIVFCLMLILSMFLGRVWCGYLCLAGGLQECAMRVKDDPAINPFYTTDHGISVSSIYNYVIYYGVFILH